MESAALKTATQTIFKNNSSKYYTKLDNKTLRIKFDDDPLTAKDIWLWALSCQDDWLITKQSIMSRYDIEAKTAQRLMARLIVSGYAKRIENRNRKTGRIEGYHYLFFESPVDKICPPVKIVKPVVNRADDVKKPVDKICPPVSLYKKKQKELPTTSLTPKQPPKQPPKKPPKPKPEIDVADIESFRKQLPPEINFRINNKTVGELFGISDDHIKWAVDEALKPWIKRKDGLFIKLCKEDMPPLPPPPKITAHKFDNDMNYPSEKLHDIDYGEHELEIRRYCDQIKKLPKKRGVYFLPFGSCKAAMQRGVPAITVLSALIGTVSNWDEINDNPKGYFEELCKNGR